MFVERQKRITNLAVSLPVPGSRSVQTSEKNCEGLGKSERIRFPSQIPAVFRLSPLTESLAQAKASQQSL